MFCSARMLQSRLRSHTLMFSTLSQVLARVSTCGTIESIHFMQVKSGFYL